jgi:ribosomal protein S18 acetylase RimI-like enzyme
MQARRGRLVDTLAGEGLVAVLDGTPVGLVTWLVEPDGARAEIRAVAVTGARRGHGYGRAAMEAAHERLRSAGVETVWLVTTNDNTVARSLYEGLGYRLVDVREGAIDDLRRTVKPSIPLISASGIAIRDELELARELDPA